MRRRRKSVAVFILLFITVISCGFGFKKETVTLDTEKYVLYKNCTVEQISSDLRKDEELAKEMYDDGYYAITGKVKEISKNHKTLVLGVEKNTEAVTIECNAADKDVVTKIENLKIGEMVVAYGKTKVSAIKANVSMEAVKLIKWSGVTTREKTYSSTSGDTYTISEMKNRKLEAGKIVYYIPTKWEGVEANNRANNKKSIEGYQYVLNEIPGDSAVEAENFFVCYFDIDDQVFQNAQKDDKKGIRKAIVDNILGTDIKSRDIKKKDTYYGLEYYYYCKGKYVDKLGQKYHVEFVFQEAGNDGIVVYLYVNQDKPKHLEDILAVMRFLEVEGE